MNVGTFEEEWESLKKNFEHGSFNYNNSSILIREIVNAHFGNIHWREKYGIYVVFREETHKVLYIGKSGTIKTNGSFKGQDIPGRLKNIKGKENISANQWFRELLKDKGPLIIEHIFLSRAPISPALAEVILLQAYLNEHECLPYLNKEL